MDADGSSASRHVLSGVGLARCAQCFACSGDNGGRGGGEGGGEGGIRHVCPEVTPLLKTRFKMASVDLHQH